MRILLFVIVLLLFPLPACGDTYIRVVARDDTLEAQKEKLTVRDAALSLLPGDAASLPAALPRAARALSEIAPCQVTLRVWSPDEKTPPAPTVYIVLGEGGGHNWWGVLYRDAVVMAGGEGEGEKIVFDWPIFAWLWRMLNPSADPEAPSGDSSAASARPAWRWWLAESPA